MFGTEQEQGMHLFSEVLMDHAALVHGSTLISARGSGCTHMHWWLGAGISSKGKVVPEIPISLKRWSVLWNNLGTSDIMYYLRAWHIKIWACDCLSFESPSITTLYTHLISKSLFKRYMIKNLKVKFNFLSLPNTVLESQAHVSRSISLKNHFHLLYSVRTLYVRYLSMLYVFAWPYLPTEAEIPIAAAAAAIGVCPFPKVFVTH